MGYPQDSEANLGFMAASPLKYATATACLTRTTTYNNDTSQSEFTQGRIQDLGFGGGKLSARSLKIKGVARLGSEERYLSD